MHDLDHNATSALRPAARGAMLAALDAGGNASSVHARGRAARAVVDRAREQVAALAHAAPEDVIFTAGGTESHNLALRGAIEGALEQFSAGTGARMTRLFVSAIEHASVMAPARRLAETAPGVRLEILPVTADGVIDLDALRVALREGKGRALVAVMAANNETGAVQPVADAARLCAEAGAHLLVDATQAAGKIAVDASLADYISLSSHKIGGPQGVGALAVKPSAPFAAQMLGGGQEMGRRSGTLNVAAIAGFGAAAEDARVLLTAELRDAFETGLKRIAPDAVILAARAPRLPNTSNFALPGINADTALMALDMDGVYVSAGSACSSGKIAASPVLAAMGVPEDLARGGLRVSFGWNSTMDDVRAALASLDKLIARVRVRQVA